MKRRNALNSLGLGISSLIALPSWANGWTGQTLPTASLSLSLASEQILDELTMVIIPETKTPGAKTLEIAKFVKLMVADIYKPAEKEKFKKGLEKVHEISKLAYGSEFMELQNAQKIHLLEGMSISSDDNQKFFFRSIKNLCVQAYTSSEYYMTTVDKFEFAPARYFGCIPLTQS